MKERLQKILSGRGVASRRRAEELITAGMVTVNGAVAALGDCADPDVDEILVKYPDLNGIMTTSAVTALGLSEATEGREISIVSVDAQEDALKAVQDGRIVALGAQSGYQIGYETIRYIVKDLEGEGTGEDEILDSRVLTEENIDTYMKDDGHSHP